MILFSRKTQTNEIQTQTLLGPLFLNNVLISKQILVISIKLLFVSALILLSYKMAHAEELPTHIQQIERLKALRSELLGKIEENEILLDLNRWTQPSPSELEMSYDWAAAPNFSQQFYINKPQSNEEAGTKDLLQSICTTKETVLVMDNFPRSQSEIIEDSVVSKEFNYMGSESFKRIIDVDGDEQMDLMHGEFVEAQLQADGYQTKRVNLAGVFSLPDLADLMKELILQIKDKKLKFSRINLSQENPLRLGAFKKDLFSEDPEVPEITGENIHLYSSKILEHLWTEVPELKVKELHDAFLELSKMNIPVVVAAGNFGPGHVNLFSMMPGVISVGSLDHLNRKLLSSSDNSYVKFWRRGVVVPTLTDKIHKGGIDLNEDDSPDLNASQLTGGEPVVLKYVDKSVAQLITSIDEEFRSWLEKHKDSGTLVPNAALNSISQGFYSVSELSQLPTITLGTKKLMSSLGQYALKLKDGPPKYFFTENVASKIVFNPRHNGMPNQLTRIPGTSFAAPRICD
jgi:hypothetical protein